MTPAGLAFAASAFLAVAGTLIGAAAAAAGHRCLPPLHTPTPLPLSAQLMPLPPCHPSCSARWRGIAAGALRLAWPPGNGAVPACAAEAPAATLMLWDAPATRGRPPPQPHLRLASRTYGPTPAPALPQSIAASMTSCNNLLSFFW